MPQLLLFSPSAMSNSLRLHRLQHARPPCPSSTPRACSNSCLSSWWCHPTIPSSVIPSPPAFNLSQHKGLFQRVSASHQGPKYWSFSFIISPSNEYLGLISYRIDWYPWCPRDSQESFPAPQFECIYSLALSLLYGPTLTLVHDYWKNHSFDYMEICQQNDVSHF